MVINSKSIKSIKAFQSVCNLKTSNLAENMILRVGVDELVLPELELSNLDWSESKVISKLRLP
ncbi:hypothetical protein DASC09_052260 [Saccharomycopsis crataegensis]|uniref:Uncharacterized protein n=1 Tax=Saccharomycopsis crataegensis TaxID=43959 RepID=A0AAV5QT75_9ASCO|nr:hypothetical protein DASC09_052260 [Saccharomycopsis crataegensis]